MAESRVFLRVDPIDPNDIRAALNRIFGSQSYTIHTMAGQVEIFTRSWEAINVAAVAAVIDQAPNIDARGSTKRELRRQASRVLVRWIAVQQGLTEEQAYAELDTIVDGL